MTDFPLSFTINNKTSKIYIESLKLKGLAFHRFTPGSYAVFYSKNLVIFNDNMDKKFDEPLGKILDLNGMETASIPQFVHPNYKDLKKFYRSRMAWVLGLSENVLSFVVYCRSPQDFRIKLDLNNLQYFDPEFGVR